MGKLHSKLEWRKYFTAYNAHYCSNSSSHFSLLSPCKAELSSNPSSSQRSFCLCRPWPEAAPKSFCPTSSFLWFHVYHFWLLNWFTGCFIFSKVLSLSFLNSLMTCIIFPPTFQFLPRFMFLFQMNLPSFTCSWTWPRDQRPWIL